MWWLGRGPRCRHGLGPVLSASRLSPVLMWLGAREPSRRLRAWLPSGCPSGRVRWILSFRCGRSRVWGGRRPGCPPPVAGLGIAAAICRRADQRGARPSRCGHPAGAAAWSNACRPTQMTCDVSRPPRRARLPLPDRVPPGRRTPRMHRDPPVRPRSCPTGPCSARDLLPPGSWGPSCSVPGVGPVWWLWRRRVRLAAVSGVAGEPRSRVRRVWAGIGGQGSGVGCGSMTWSGSVIAQPFCSGASAGGAAGVSSFSGSVVSSMGRSVTVGAAARVSRWAM